VHDCIKQHGGHLQKHHIETVMINLKSHEYGIYLPVFVTFLHIVLKCYVISKQLYVSGTPCFFFVCVCVFSIISEQA
jgi:hypothetical protein